MLLTRSVLGYVLDLPRNKVEGKQQNEANRNDHIDPERKGQRWADPVPSIVLAIDYLAHTAPAVGELAMITSHLRR